MDYKIIVDSCCDMTIQLEKRLGVTRVPLTMILGDNEYKDDKKLNLGDFMSKMKSCVGKIGSAAPSPASYMEAIKEAGKGFVVTLSSRLSGSYSSAKTGQTLAAEEGTEDVHVFDSKSASAGQVLLAVKIRELIDRGLHMNDIIKRTETFISQMKTYFVLEHHDNLVKNGRISKLSSRLLGCLDIKLIMGSDGDGRITLYSKPRGEKKMIDRLVSLIGDSGRGTGKESLVISHCNNESLASKLEAEIRRLFNFKEIFVVPTGGISSLYADDKGIVMAF